ncbi:MAG: sigma-54 interaction domain-containing protein [Desulfovibrionaceae bacterium]
MTEAEIHLYLKDILDTMNDGLVLIRPDGRIMMVNDAMCRLTGYSRDELLDQPCSVLGCDACQISRREGRAHWRRLFDTGRESRKSCHLLRKDGSPLHVLKNAALLQDNGRLLGAVETVTDITELDQRDLRIKELSRRVCPEEGFHGLVGDSPGMRKVYDILERAAASTAPVLIMGESGTGKELAARAIHDLGPRRDGPFVQINCAALSEPLLESELFGHVKGAFTGAYRHRTGRFEEAQGGDVLLDEIGDVPLSLQVKLLRVLETRRFERVGDSRPIPFDARIISATNRNLQELAGRERFREDFLFRINVIPIQIPPLRERKPDIPLLAEHLLKQVAAQSGAEVPHMAPEVLRVFMDHPWPGNVREMKSALEYAMVVLEGGRIGVEHLPPDFGGAAASGPVQPPAPGRQPDEDMPTQKARLIDALQRSGGNKSQAARILGVHRITVLNRMRKYGLDLKKVLTS